MRSFVLLFATALAPLAHADIFAFNDVVGFEKCLMQTHVADVKNTATGKQGQFLNQVDIQIKCIENASAMLKSGKRKPEEILEYVKAVKRQSAHEQSLSLIQVLVDNSLKECNNMEAYGVLTKALAHPKDYPSVPYSYYRKVQGIVKTCLKDKEFKADFMEEKDSGKAYVADNACSILVEEKLVKSCKKG